MSEAKLAEQATRKEPVLKLKFLSHGTLDCRNLEFTRKFYEEFLGIECVQTSPISLLIRLGGAHTYAVVQNDKKSHEMPFLNHNGLDVGTDDEVNRCHEIVLQEADKWGLKKISNPKAQHGTYSFYFWDADDNCWEILSNPEGGYSWLFNRGDQEGRGHMAKGYDRPV